MSTHKPAAKASDNSPLLFADLGPRQVVADFSGGHLSSDGGILLLRQLDQSLGLTRRLAACFEDQRDARFVEHQLEELLAQRVQGLALGYEDLNDHQQLRRDPLLAVGAGKRDPLGETRPCERDRGQALAAPSTLNRLELGNNKQTRYHKISHDPARVEALLLQEGVRCLPKHAREVVLDFDATDDPLHGQQEGRYFNGYYDEYCYLPLYGFVGAIPMWAQLQTSEKEACAGALEALKKIVGAIRKRCPKARIILRADSGFCRDELMVWCEGQPEVYYCLGLGCNSRLEAMIPDALADARARRCLTGAENARCFKELSYQTLESWSRTRRVVAKAEVSAKGDNPRFVVTNLPKEGFGADPQAERDRFTAANVYEKFYCARGNMENVIKQQVLDLGADRTSTHFMASNQLRLWLTTLAYLLLERLRARTLQGTELAQATVGTIRLRLLKVAALVTVSVRRVYVQLCSAFPLQELFGQCLQRLSEQPPET